MITHQYVPDPTVKSEISKGRDDLYEAIPWLSDHAEEICVHSYHRNWPCNRPLRAQSCLLTSASRGSG